MALEGEVAPAWAALIQSKTRVFWKPFVDAWSTKPRLARCILVEIADREFLEGWPFYSLLSESELADFFSCCIRISLLQLRSVVVREH